MVRSTIRLLLVLLAASMMLFVGVTPARASAAQAAGRMPWPIASVHLIASYRVGEHNWDAGHRGVDLAALPGTPLSSPLDGIVRFAGVVNDRPVISLLRADGVVVTLEPAVTELGVGAPVATGQVIGAVGLGGHCDRRCLHVGVIVAGEYASPMRYFRLPFARLLPTLR